MRKELEYMIIEYTEKDLAYIDSIIYKINNISNEIVNFLNIREFGDKVYVLLNDSLNIFRKKYIQTGYSLDKEGKVPSWSCGFAFGNRVETLCLEEYRKTLSHENDNINDLIYLILHEFVHSCHNKVNKNIILKYAWISEGLATTISHQYDDAELIFNATLDQIINGNIDYRNYHTMFRYVLDNYGKMYVLKLISDADFLVKETPKLYDEVNKKYSVKKNERK